MREFFKGWRRKAGCIALVIAVVLTGAWIRSRVVMDVFTFEREGTEFQLVSENGRAFYCTWNTDELMVGYFSFWETAPIPHGDEYDRWIADVTQTHPHLRAISIRYWSVTIPLILLSACLILWKPQPKE